VLFFVCYFIELSERTKSHSKIFKRQEEPNDRKVFWSRSFFVALIVFFGFRWSKC